jgi:hypothetical protein
MTTLIQLIHQLENQIDNHEKLNLTISESSIGWHLDHSLMVINGIIIQLKNSNPEQYKWRFNLKRGYIKTINKISRGKGKAPKVVQPKEIASKEILTTKLEASKINIIELENLPTNSYFNHPYFGDLNLKNTIWFLKLHTYHHLKIINDINNNG